MPATKTRPEPATRTSAAPKRLSNDQMTKAKKELATALVRGDDRHLLAYLDHLTTTAANAQRAHGIFKRWSMSNRLTLEAQRRRLGENHHGLYAGSSQWGKLERSVRPDARPKIIWAFSGTKPDPNAAATTSVPSTSTTATSVTSTAPVAPAPAPHRTAPRTRFVPVTVYDWSDTVADDPDQLEPDWSVPLCAGDRTTFGTLVASSPVPVTVLDQPARAEHGVTAREGITLYNASAPVGNQIATLLHEFGHQRLDHLDRLAAAPAKERDAVRAVCEQEAQLVAWLAMKSLGLDEQLGNDITAATATYLRSWTDPESGEVIDGTKRRMKLLTQRLDVAMDAVDAILTSYTTVSTGESPVTL